MKEKIKEFFKSITLNQIVKLSIIFAFFIIGFSFFYHYVISLPKQERTKELEKQASRELLESCLRNAEKKYRNIGIEMTQKAREGCEKLKTLIDLETCFTQTFPFETLKKGLQEAKDECFKKYPLYNL